MSKPVTAAPWSFSRIKAFEQCPKQFYHEKVLKQYPFRETEAMLMCGSEVSSTLRS